MPVSDDRSIPAQLRWWAKKCNAVLAIGCKRWLSANGYSDSRVKEAYDTQRDGLSSVSQALREMAERVERERMNDAAFYNTLALLMCSDPWPDGVDREPIQAFVDAECARRGFENWIDAYHGEPLVRREKE